MRAASRERERECVQMLSEFRRQRQEEELRPKSIASHRGGGDDRPSISAGADFLTGVSEAEVEKTGAKAPNLR
ncbi:hypothetical protein F2P81_008383 [Scophthalmus maximus]|uniref:Uncharacterized protein n=1 Tax=Scophthalmus maximus TaxID=52904 RepID=A0A6A4T749_SCOMX|nr:hypothetical protein F2P81_008383 [Scophthalmus maximus]